MWRHIAQSVQGSAHAADNSSCQDYCAVRCFGEGAEAALVACASDGAGSTKNGGVGAKMACEQIIASAADHYDARGSLAGIDAAVVLGWCEESRRGIADFAELCQIPFRDYASTLCVAVVTPANSVFLQIGDGAIVGRRHGVTGVVFWPQSGEYVNTTHFLTSPEFHDRVQLLDVDGGFDDIALLTDGIERLALKFDILTPHAPFFEPLFKVLRTTGDASNLERDLALFLNSPSIRDKTDDDRTLVLGSRVDHEPASLH